MKLVCKFHFFMFVFLIFHFQHTVDKCIHMKSISPYRTLALHRLVIRIRCDAAVAQHQLGMKFGCNAVTEAPHLLKVAQSLGLHVVGVSFHVGSGCGDAQAFHKAIESAKMVFDVETNLGFSFHLLDIGGGYPGNKGTSIDKVSYSC
jgi:diaminopimelate decarboxylase